MIKGRIKIELPCDDCDGSGETGSHEDPDGAGILTCSSCDGEGYQELYVAFDRLKHILDGGDL